MKCEQCGEEISGPDKADVAATMARHQAKFHPKKGKK